MKHAIVAAILLLAAPALGQARDTGILLNIDVGYNTAYRNATWVPVDVLIENNQRDFDGWAEVRVYDAAGAMKSPTYRVEADCPQNSKKRFRLYAWIDNATRVEAVLYENDRLAVDAPAYIEPQPIGANDLLAIVLDEDPLNYQFLYEPLRRLEANRRISRQDLGSSTLGQLPDHLAAYEALDFIVVGDVDVTRIPARQRALLLEFVELGGTLVVFTGVNAQRIRDSWLAPHLGVRIESLTTQPEALYRSAVFGDPPPTNVDPTAVCTAATLVQSDPDVQTFGANAILAARRDLGNGRIVTFATDTRGNALQDDPRYTDLWHTIFTAMRREIRGFNTEIMDATFINNLPQVSGVTIRPVSDVLLYLSLYIGVGIVLNWLFWSRIGRREYAWLTLLVVSSSFTAYAVVSGTSGIEGRQTRHQFTLLHLGDRTTLAWEHAMTGILSARVTEINEPLDTAGGLVREAGVSTSAGRWGIPEAAFQRPFHAVQAPDSAIRNLRIGANEVRGFATSGYRRLDGAVEGYVVEQPDGIEVSIRNATGFALESPMIYLHGQFHALQHADGEFRYVPEPFVDEDMQIFANARYGGYGPASFYSNNWSNLVAYLTLCPFIDEITTTTDPSMGPYFIARILESDATADRVNGNDTTVLIARIDYRSDQRERYPLPQRVGPYSRYTFPLEIPNDWHATLSGTPLELYLRVPDALAGAADAYIDVELVTSGDEAVLRRGIGPRTELNRTHLDRSSVITKRYRIDDWKSLIAPTGDLTLAIEPVSSANARTSQVRVTAEMRVTPADNQQEWPGWQ